MRTTTNKIKVSALRPTKSVDHPAIWIQFGEWALSETHEIEVRTPAALELRNADHLANSARGYRSIWEYAAVDQFGDPLPAVRIPVEVQWESGQTEIFRGNNWTRGPSGVRAL